MKTRFAVRLARWEARASVRRIGVYTGAIALGVAALVAINSFRAGVVQSVEAEARSLLGADLRLSSSAAFPEQVAVVLDSVAAEGVDVSYVTRLASMVRATRSGGTRLLQVHAIEGGYPFYGDVAIEPAGVWPLTGAERHAVVEPAVLVQLDAAVGDTLAIGNARFVIAGTIDGLGVDVGFQSAIGPRVYIPAAYLAETGLVQFGSLVRYQAYLRFGDVARAEAFEDAHRELLREARVGSRTVADQAEDLTEAFGSLGRYLGLVGLMAMLLGGIGVASAVHAYVREKVPQIAVLRCLGATRRSVFGAYLLQTGAIGLGGAAAGAALGVAVQAVLPAMVGDALPVDVAFRVHWPAILGGVAAGATVSALFALLPLLTVRDVPPLQALRRDFEPARAAIDPWRSVAYGALALGVVGLSIAQAPGPGAGIGFAAGIGATLALLAATALIVAHTARRFVPRSTDFAVRQGIANLFRPRNQTGAVTLSIGFGVFLLATLHLVQANLLDRFRIEASGDRPNLLLFDLQTDQLEGVRSFLESRGVRLEQATPLVPARIAAIGGRSASELLADTTGAAPERWALRREYRNTYRAELAETEELVAGEWWGDRARSRLPRISVEEDLARELRVGLGDRITWDVQGVPIETEVASLRRVDWARFSPNFFVVFEPGVLEEAPQTIVALARVPESIGRAELQRDLVERWPNVSALDLTQVQEALDGIVGKASLAVRFLALFAIGGGLVVLAGSLATTRFQRMRELALLRTLGASRAQLRRVLWTEYFALGAVSGLAGAALAAVAAWVLTTGLFEMDFRLPATALAVAWGATSLLTAALGYLNSRGLLDRPPLAVLREADRG